MRYFFGFWIFTVSFSVFHPVELFASSIQKPLQLYQNEQYKDVVDYFKSSVTAKNEIRDDYMLYKANLQLNNFAQSLEHLDILEKEIPDALSDLILFEKILVLKDLKRTSDLLNTIANYDQTITNPYLVKQIVDILIENFQSHNDQKLLRKAIQQLMPFSQSLEQAPELLRLYKKTFPKDSPEIEKVNILIWTLGDATKLDQKDKLVENIIKADVSKQIQKIRRHFRSQYKFKNYTYMINTMPAYFEKLSSAGVSENELKELRRLYLSAMNKKRRYTQLIEVLKHKKKQKNLGLTDTNAKLLQFDYYLKKGHTKTAINILNDLIKQDPTINLDLKYLALATYYFERNKFKQALYFYQRLEPFQNPIYDLSEVKWNLWRIHQKTENKQELKAIADWAQSYKFLSSEMGARFCYWGHKLKLYEKQNLQSCHDQYPFSYYGLHSSFQAPAELALITSNQVESGIKAFQPSLPESEIHSFRFLKMAYQLSDPEMLDSIIRQKLDKMEPGTMLFYAKMLLNAERYYLVQLIVESRFRNYLENDSSNNLLLPYFFPLAYDETVKQLEQKPMIPKTLILSVMREESHFNPNVESVAGAIGLMQLMPTTAKYIGKKIGLKVKVDSLDQPELNIKLGSAYLKRLMKRYKGNVFYALAAYNGGPTNVRRWIKRANSSDNDEFVETITFPETQNYVRRVMRTYYMYQKLYGQL